MNKRNSEGYYDPTASKAIETISKEERQVNRLIHMIKDVAALAGCEIVGRIEVECKESGRRYK